MALFVLAVGHDAAVYYYSELCPQATGIWRALSMKTLSVVSVLVLLGAAVPTALADVVVFKDGSCEDDVTIKNVTADTLTIAGPYGDLPYPIEQVYWFHQSVPDRPGIELYWAGVKLLDLHKRHTAQKLFDRAGKFDRRYAEAGARAIKSYTPQAPTDYASRLGPSDAGVTGDVLVFKVVCKLCGGKGEVEYKVQQVAATDPDDEYYFPTGAG
jgi:hypothetical protein